MRWVFAASMRPLALFTACWLWISPSPVAAEISPCWLFTAPASSRVLPATATIFPAVLSIAPACSRVSPATAIICPAVLSRVSALSCTPFVAPICPCWLLMLPGRSTVSALLPRWTMLPFWLLRSWALRLIVSALSVPPALLSNFPVRTVISLALTFALAVFTSPAPPSSRRRLPWVWLPLTSTPWPRTLRSPPARVCPWALSWPLVLSSRSPASASLPSLFTPAASTLCWLPVKLAALTRTLLAAVMTPLLFMSLAVCRLALSLARKVPLFSMRPSAERVTVPAWAPMAPALRTPTPLSVPTMRILPAYMPPRLATSTASCGRVAGSSLPFSMTSWAASTLLRPVVTFRSLAHSPALTFTERAMMSV